MKKLTRQITSFLGDECGATTIEYMFALSLVIVVLVVAITALGGKVSTMFGSTNQQWASI